ncbi:unnamed protein product [Camellia sinensis]
MSNILFVILLFACEYGHAMENRKHVIITLIVASVMQELWRRRVENYWNLLSPKITSDTLRNLMNMKANLGSFGVALKEKDEWVMNVVLEDGPNTLKITYDRGLIGTVHSC